MANKSQKRAPKNSKPKNKTPCYIPSMPMPQLVLQDTIQAKRITDTSMDFSSFAKLIELNYVGNPTTFKVQIIGPNAERMATNAAFMNSFIVGVAKQDQTEVTVISRKSAIELQSISKCDQGIELSIVICVSSYNNGRCSFNLIFKGTDDKGISHGWVFRGLYVRSKTAPLSDTPNGKKRGRPSTHNDDVHDEDESEQEVERPKKRAKRNTPPASPIPTVQTPKPKRATSSKPIVVPATLSIPATGSTEAPKSLATTFAEAASPVAPTMSTPQLSTPNTVDAALQPPAFASLHFDFHIVPALMMQPSPRDVKPLDISSNLEQQVERLGSPHTHALFDDMDIAGYNNGATLFDN